MFLKNTERLEKPLCITLGLVYILILEISLPINSNILITISIINIFLGLILIIKYYKNILLYVLFIFITYILYSITIGRYVNPSIAKYNSIIDYSYDLNALIAIGWFLISIIYFGPKYKEIRHTNVYANKYYPLGSLLLILSGISLQIFFLYTEKGERAGYHPLYEYSIVFYLIGFYFCPIKNRKYFYFIIFIFILRELNSGNRVTALQQCLMILAFSQNLITRKRIILMIPIALVIFGSSVISRNESLDQDFVSYVKNLFGSEQLWALDTAYFSHVTSLTFIAAREEYSFLDLMGFFKDYLASNIVVGTVGKSLYEIARENYNHANGGILPIYFYFYLGTFGSILSGYIVTRYLNLLKFSNYNINFQHFKNCLFIYFIITSPRWLIYSPNQLIRGAMIFSILYLSFMILQKFISGKSGLRKIH